jgi:hypothetical protein
MPSYRRDRPSSARPSGRPGGPGPRPSSFRREEPEEEEQGFRRPSFLRREGGPSEFASRPVGPSERRELWEVLVPKSEQEDPYFDYSKVFEVLRPGRGATPRGYEGPRAEAPRGAGYERGPERGPGSQRPAREPGAPPLLDAGQFFDLSRIWNAVMALKHDPRFKVGSPVAVVRTAPQAEVHRFFRIQPGDVAPFLDELSYAINTVKPRELPGRFLFQRGADGFVWLAYVE